MKVLDAEKKVGINVFFTKPVGIGGKLRTIPEDFIVEEVSEYPPQVNDGLYSIAEITLLNWETNTVVRDLSDWLHVSRNRISFAGTKDKRAKTTQLMSFYKIPKEKIAEIKKKDVEIKNIYRSNSPVVLGSLIGNKFDIKIRNIKDDIKKNDIKQISDTITENEGFPNFFGIQRFGIVRPITHEIGKNIVFDDFEKAVMNYIANPMDEEDNEIFALRQQLQKTRDYKQALKLFPDALNFEKAILNRLVITPKDYINALKELPKNLLTMFVYAYQSYLFNKILSERIKRDLPINRAIVGDYISPVKRGTIDESIIPVLDSNIEKVNYQISRGKAVVSGPLFGYDSVFSKAEMGEIEHKIIEEEKIDPRDFIIPDFPSLSSKGTRRALNAPIKDFNYSIEEDDINKGKKMVNLKFELKKGCYATSILREFMKSENIKNY